MALAAIPGVALPAIPGDPPPGTYRYAISYPMLGRIGTFTNIVKRDGDRIIVVSELRIDVKTLAISLHRVTGSSEEVWQGDRLLHFTNTTDDDGKVLKTVGRADGDKFVIDGPDGRIAAPPNLFSSNPWTIRFAGANSVMSTSRGSVTPVSVRETSPETVAVGDRQVAARHFTVEGGGGGQVWFGPDGTPVVFSFKAEGQDVTFTRL
jgi:hypothetical protein